MVGWWSPTQWTWVWVASKSWWWIGRPGVLRFMGSQRVGHNRATELHWTEVNTKQCQRLDITTSGHIWELQINIPNFSFFLNMYTVFHSFNSYVSHAGLWVNCTEAGRPVSDSWSRAGERNSCQGVPGSDGEKYYRWSWVCLQVVFLMDLNVRTESLNCRFQRKYNFGGDQT